MTHLPAVTGSKPRSLIKKELHLRADNEQEAANGRLSCFVDVSRNGTQLLKLNEKFKAVELISWKFPLAITDKIWFERVQCALRTDDFQKSAEGHNYKLSVSDNRLTIVPETLFSEKEKEKHLEFVSGSSQNYEVIAQKLSNLEATGVFSYPKAFNELSEELPTSSTLTFIDSVVGNSTGNQAILVPAENQFALIIIKQGQLVYSNWFKHTKTDDILYYLMAALESLNILHSEIKLMLAGTVSKDDETARLISRYISKVSFFKRPKNLTYSYSFNQLAEHRLPFIFAVACA